MVNDAAGDLRARIFLLKSLAERSAGSGEAGGADAARAALADLDDLAARHGLTANAEFFHDLVALKAVVGGGLPSAQPYRARGILSAPAILAAEKSAEEARLLGQLSLSAQILASWSLSYGPSESWPDGIKAAAAAIRDFSNSPAPVFETSLIAALNGLRTEAGCEAALDSALSIAASSSLGIASRVAALQAKISSGLPEGALRAGVHFVSSPLTLAFPVWSGRTAARLASAPLVNLAKLSGASTEATAGLFQAAHFAGDVTGFYAAGKIAHGSIGTTLPAEAKELAATAVFLGLLRGFGAGGQALANLISPATAAGTALRGVVMHASSITGLAHTEVLTEAMHISDGTSTSAGERYLRALFLHGTLMGLGAIATDSRDAAAYRDIARDAGRMLAALRGHIARIAAALDGRELAGPSGGRMDDILLSEAEGGGGGSRGSRNWLLDVAHALEKAANMEGELRRARDELQMAQAELEEARQRLAAQVGLTGVKVGDLTKRVTDALGREADLQSQLSALRMGLIGSVEPLRAVLAFLTGIREMNVTDVEAEARKAASLVEKALRDIEVLRDTELTAAGVATVEPIYHRIEELGLPWRAHNALNKIGVEYIGELCQMTEADVLRIKNAGRKTLKEIKAKLSEKGLMLGMRLRGFTREAAEARDDARRLAAAVPAVATGAPAARAVPGEPSYFPFSWLELSVRATNCLEAAEIRSIGELCQKTEADLLRSKNFGRKSIEELKGVLKAFGLDLGMNLAGFDPEAALRFAAQLMEAESVVERRPSDESSLTTEVSELVAHVRGAGDLIVGAMGDVVTRYEHSGILVVRPGITGQGYRAAIIDNLLPQLEGKVWRDAVENYAYGYGSSRPLKEHRLTDLQRLLTLRSIMNQGRPGTLPPAAGRSSHGLF